MKTKMKLLASLKIWLVIYPSITLFLALLGAAAAVGGSWYSGAPHDDE